MSVLMGTLCFLRQREWSLKSNHSAENTKYTRGLVIVNVQSPDLIDSK